MSNILNKIQIQGNPTVTYDLLGGAIPCFGPYVDQSTGHITELYGDYEQLIFITDKIENALYIDLYTGKLYSYTRHHHFDTDPVPADFWFIPVSVETTQSTIPCYGCIYASGVGVQNIRGLWLDEAHTKRTPEATLSNPLDENIIYQDRTTGARYTYKNGDTEEFGGFVLISPITVMAETTTTTATINIPEEVNSASANVYDVNIFTNDGASYSSITQEGTTNPTLTVTFEEAPAEGSTRKVYCSFSQIWGYFA